ERALLAASPERVEGGPRDRRRGVGESRSNEAVGANLAELTQGQQFIHVTNREVTRLIEGGVRIRTIERTEQVERERSDVRHARGHGDRESIRPGVEHERRKQDRKSTRLNSSHVENTYDVFWLKKK